MDKINDDSNEDIKEYNKWAHKLLNTEEVRIIDSYEIFEELTMI